MAFSIDYAPPVKYIKLNLTLISEYRWDIVFEVMYGNSMRLLVQNCDKPKMKKSLLLDGDSIVEKNQQTAQNDVFVKYETTSLKMELYF